MVALGSAMSCSMHPARACSASGHLTCIGSSACSEKTRSCAHAQGHCVFTRGAMAAADAAMASLFSLVPAGWLNEALKVFDGKFEWKYKRGPKSFAKEMEGQGLLRLKKDAWYDSDHTHLTVSLASAQSGINVTILTDTAEDVMKFFKDRVLDKFHGGMVKTWIESSWFQVQKDETRWCKNKYVFALFPNRIIFVEFNISMIGPNNKKLYVITKAERFPGLTIQGRRDPEIKDRWVRSAHEIIESHMNGIARTMFPYDVLEALEKTTRRKKDRMTSQIKLDFAEKNLPVYQQVKWRSVLQSDKALAAMMAIQPRLGAKSPLHHLDDMLVRNIVQSTLQEIDTKTLAEFLRAFFEEGYEQALQRFQLQAQLPDVCAACGRLVLQ